MYRLTPRQKDILAYLRDCATHEHAPTLEEICAALGLRSRGSLHRQVQALEAAGLVEPARGRRRGVHLTEAAREPERLPLLGRIAAGRPIEALAGEERIEAPSPLHGGRASYALEVRGDSMVDAGVLDGDWVLVEHRSHARNGEMVVALIDGSEATLKYIDQTPDGVILRPANPEHPEQHYPADRVTIQGVVVGQMRRY